MGTIADKLLYLSDTKTILRTAINAAGGALTVSTPFRQYAQWITEQSATLSLDFVKQSYIAKTSALVPDRIDFSNIITLTRASGGGRFNASGNYEYLGNDVPRLDYDPVTLAPRGILIEEQRTNLLTYSEQFDNAAWTKTAASVVANAVVSPDGTADADKLVEDTSASTSHRVFRAFTATANSAHTYSVFLKKDTRTWARISLFDGSNTWAAFFNLATGAVGTISGAGSTAKIEPVGNDWYRCSVSATGAFTQVATNIATGDNVIIYTGDGTSGLYIWGAQLEAGAFPTSYIPTVASQVTRSADAASVNTLSPWYNATEGTLFAECFSAQGSSAVQIACSLNDGTNNNYIALVNRNASNIYRAATVKTAGVDVAVLSPTPVAFGLVSCAAAYRENEFSAVLNGGAPAIDTSGGVPMVSSLAIGRLVTGNYWNGHIRNISYYPRRLTNTELQILTTP